MARSELDRPLAGRRIVLSNGMYESAFGLMLAAVGEGAEVHVVCSGSTGDVARSRRVAGRHEGPEARPAHESLLEGAPLDPFAERMLEVAEQVGADIVIGSTDDEVASLASAGPAPTGRTVTVPPIDVVRRMMDKGRSVRAAEEAGIPVPVTAQVTRLADLEAFAREHGFPVVLKQTISTTSRGVRLVREPSQCASAYDELAGRPLIVQEWVPGPREPSVSVMRRSDGEVQLDLTLRKQRYLHASLSTSISAETPLPEADAVVRYADLVGAVGFVGVQLREDPRRGVHVFLESNPRWGANSRMVIPLLRRHGMSPMADFVDCWEGRRDVVHRRPERGTAVSPLEDALALRSLALLKTTHRRREFTWNDVARSYWHSYVGQRPTTDDLFKEAWSDPGAWWSAARRAVRERHAEIRLIPLGELTV